VLRYIVFLGFFLDIFNLGIPVSVAAEETSDRPGARVQEG
jgi:hypothetical protein